MLRVALVHMGAHAGCVGGTALTVQHENNGYPILPDMLTGDCGALID